jgi:hypothetical protein
VCVFIYIYIYIYIYTHTHTYTYTHTCISVYIRTYIHTIPGTSKSQQRVQHMGSSYTCHYSCLPCCNRHQDIHIHVCVSNWVNSTCSIWFPHIHVIVVLFSHVVVIKSITIAFFIIVIILVAAVIVIVALFVKVNLCLCTCVCVYISIPIYICTCTRRIASSCDLNTCIDIDIHARIYKIITWNGLKQSMRTYAKE